MSVMTKPPFAFSAVGKPATILAKEGFLLSKSILILTGRAGGYFALKLQLKSAFP